MIHGIQYINKDVFYVRKAHFCPHCKTKMKTVKVSRVVNSRSPEAKDFDFSNGDTYMVGNIKFVWKEFECPSCGLHLTVQQMKEAEGVAPLEKEPKRRMGIILFVAVAILLAAVYAMLAGKS